MKKAGIALLLCVLLPLSCFGCGGREPVLQAGSVNAVLNARMTETLLPAAEDARQPSSEVTEPPSEVSLETEAAAPDTSGTSDTTEKPAATEAPTDPAQELPPFSESADSATEQTPSASDAPETTEPQGSQPPATAAEETESPLPETEPPAPATEQPPQNVGYPDVDFDLTMLSSTVVISQLNNMMVDPAPYIGYVVRLCGAAIVYSDGSPACLISDAGGCCQEALHYSLRQGLSYPAEGSYITIIGTFGTYYINGVLYCRLYDAVLES